MEYDMDTAAQKAVDAENGRDFKGAKLGIKFFSLSICMKLKHMMHQCVTGRWVCDDRFYGLVNRSNR